MLPSSADQAPAAQTRTPVATEPCSVWTARISPPETVIAVTAHPGAIVAPW